ncbi:MAG: acetylornithine/succinylornithine family transaminase [Verrucomicrobiales bacterium]|jgi:acetylornithine aminotransferase/acetylornithine/N-succinyldiaminopimelate aminotransferase|nr:acetylornithine/succinylornithine family transaminase [Verrucomicrobiales bacterium]
MEHVLGGNRQELQNKAEAVKNLYAGFVVPSYKRSLVLSHGQGMYVWDADGKRYLDMGGGIAVNSLGHSNPRIAETLAQQAGKLVHVSNLYYNEQQAILAQRLVSHLAPGKMFFCNSGAEANECQYKLARKVGNPKGRFEIVTALNSFHGRTLAGIAATGQDKVRVGFEPTVSGFRHVPYNNLEAVRAAITEQTAAVLIEGIQGEGGVTAATPEYLVGLRKLTREHGILLLWDGVQCGYFRTGRFQSFQRILEDSAISGAQEFLPDAVAMAKSIGGGFPMGAVWIRDEFADVFQPGSHGTTYGGTPLACAVANCVLDEIEEKRLDENIRKQGEYLISRLASLVGSRGINAVRGMGGIVGLALESDAAEAATKLTQAGLLLVPATGNVLRFLPPLNMGKAHVDEALEIIEKTL